MSTVVEEHRKAPDAVVVDGDRVYAIQPSEIDPLAAYLSDIHRRGIPSPRRFNLETEPRRGFMYYRVADGDSTVLKFTHLDGTLAKVVLSRRCPTAPLKLPYDLDEHETGIVRRYMAKPRPTLVLGRAGTGKTDVMMKLLWESYQFARDHGDTTCLCYVPGSFGTPSKVTTPLWRRHITETTTTMEILSPRTS